ncbi:MAG: NADH-dependent flavin oxidoreductase [Succinivibrio sp.]|nr:NADH-dependent flavin oxidoreductase [Succinivibrio sp.]
MLSKYRPLFEPLALNNGVTVHNRLAAAPLTLFSSNPDGSVSDGERMFLTTHSERIGLYILGATLVQPDGQAFATQPRAISEADLDALAERAVLVKQGGGKAVLQIHHGGAQALPELTGTVPSVPSALQDGQHEMSAEEVTALIESFGRATELAIRAGFDGVEIHGANNYILQQFYSAATNHRQDEWGGSPEKRLRFPLAVVDTVCAARAKLQRPDFIVGYRLSPEEPGEEGLTMTETLDLVEALCGKPLQYLHISLWDFYKKARRGKGAGEPRLKLIHDQIAGRLPLIGVGNLFNADDLVAALNSGRCEFVALGKSLMINPRIATLIYEGRESELIGELDPHTPGHYGIPQPLWEMCVKGGAWLPPVKGLPHQNLDL